MLDHAGKLGKVVTRRYEVARGKRRLAGRLAFLACLIVMLARCGSPTKPCGTFGFTGTPSTEQGVDAQVDFSFTPDTCGVACTCTEVAYVQMVRFMDLDTGAFFAPNSQQEDRMVTGLADGTQNGWAIDRTSNRVWGHYGRRDDGSFFAYVTTGSNTTVAAMKDWPRTLPNTSFEAVSVSTCISAGSTCVARSLGAYYWMFGLDKAGTASPPFHEVAVTWMQDAFGLAVTEWNKDAGALGKHELPAMSPLP